jgi:ATP-dependent DNA ligase
MALRLPSPMLARSGAIPSGDYGFKVKWDGFRALVSRNGDFQVARETRASVSGGGAEAIAALRRARANQVGA